MHPTKPLDYIYVEKTPEQYYLGCSNSQGLGKVPDGTSTQVVAQMMNKWRAKII